MKLSLFKIAIIVSASLALVGCQEDNDAVNTFKVGLQAPLIRPPVENTTPAGLKGSAYQNAVPPKSAKGPLAAGLTVINPLETIKERFFSSGPTDILSRLGSVDERMSSLETRAAEAPGRQCLAETAQSFSLGGDLPKSQTFPMAFQCSEELSSQLQMSLGGDTKDFFVAEVQVMDEGNYYGVFSRAPLGGDEVEVWTANYEPTGTGSLNTTGAPEFLLMHIYGSTESNAFEVVVAGKSGSNGVSCGVHLKSDGTYLYATGDFNDVYSGSGCDGSDTTLCVLASDLSSVDAALCQAAGLNTFSLTDMRSADVDAAAVKAIATSTFSGLTDFNQEYQP